MRKPGPTRSVPVPYVLDFSLSTAPRAGGADEAAIRKLGRLARRRRPTADVEPLPMTWQEGDRQSAVFSAGYANLPGVSGEGLLAMRERGLVGWWSLPIAWVGKAGPVDAHLVFPLGRLGEVEWQTIVRRTRVRGLVLVRGAYVATLPTEDLAWQSRNGGLLALSHAAGELYRDLCVQPVLVTPGAEAETVSSRSHVGLRRYRAAPKA